MRAVFVSYVRDTPCHQKVAMAPTCMKVLKLTGDYMHLTQRSLFLSILYFSILLLQPLPCDSIKTYHKNKLLGKPSSTKTDTFFTYCKGGRGRPPCITIHAADFDLLSTQNLHKKGVLRVKLPQIECKIVTILVQIYHFFP